jgi:hypothetical protein
MTFKGNLPLQLHPRGGAPNAYSADSKLRQKETLQIATCARLQVLRKFLPENLGSKMNANECCMMPDIGRAIMLSESHVGVKGSPDKKKPRTRRPPGPDWN